MPERRPMNGGNRNEGRPIASQAILALILLGCGTPASVSPSEPAHITTVADHEVATPTVSCTVAARGALTARREISAAATTHVDACRSAAEQLRASGATSIELIDDLAPGWLVSPTADRLPEETELAHEAECELAVAFDVGQRVEGAGSGSSEEEAFERAWNDACRALGAADCGEANGYRAHVMERRSYLHFGTDGERGVFDVKLTLARIRLVNRRATSRASRAAACREAYRSACGADSCSEGARLDSLDGVSL